MMDHHASLSNSSSVFVSKTWFKAFADHIHHNKNNFSVPLTENGDLAFFSSCKNSGRTHALTSMTNYYSPIYGFADQYLETIPSVKILKEQERIFTPYDSIDILPLYSSQAQAWAAAFKTLGFKSFIYQHSVNWFQPDITSVADYWQQRPSQLKNTLKRKQELMKKDKSFSIRIYSEGSTEVFMQALIDYHTVYFHSWKQLEPTPSFIDSVCLDNWHSNSLRIGVIYYNEQPIAAQIWFVYDNTAAIFKLAYNKNFTRFSPGTVLTATLLEHVIGKDQIKKLDFLTGNDDYKKDWMTLSQPLYGILLCNKHTLRGKMLIVKNSLARLKPKSLIE